MVKGQMVWFGRTKLPKDKIRYLAYLTALYLQNLTKDISNILWKKKSLRIEIRTILDIKESFIRIKIKGKERKDEYRENHQRKNGLFGKQEGR